MHSGGGMLLSHASHAHNSVWPAHSQITHLVLGAETSTHNKAAILVTSHSLHSFLFTNLSKLVRRITFGNSFCTEEGSDDLKSRMLSLQPRVLRPVQLIPLKNSITTLPKLQIHGVSYRHPFFGLPWTVRTVCTITKCNWMLSRLDFDLTAVLMCWSQSGPSEFPLNLSKNKNSDRI